MTQAVAATVSPQEQIMGFIMSIVQGRCVVAAAELELADVLAKGPLPVETIAGQAKADVDHVFRLMRALETIGLFTQVAPRVFANTPLSECLRKDVPGSVWSFARICAPGWVYWDGYSEMLPTLRTGTTSLFQTWGYDLWEHYRRKPEQSVVFNDAMRTMTGVMTPAVTAAYDWSRFPVIADIGGGIGSQLVDILDANPRCRGVLFDQPDVVSTAIAHDRIDRVPGSFFEHIPVEADAYVLRNIIHDWDDAGAVTILKTVRKAAKPDARVALVEWVIGDTSEFQFGKWTDITMMTGVGGRERTRDEFGMLFDRAGFALEEIIPTASMFSIVVGRPV